MKMNKNLQNYHGTFMWKDLPLIDLKIVDWKYLVFEVHQENVKYLPIEIMHYPDVFGFEICLQDRLFPESRQNLKEVLNSLGIERYAIDEIIKSNYGLNTDDCRWFKPHGSSLIYDDIKIRD